MRQIQHIFSPKVMSCLSCEFSPIELILHKCFSDKCLHTHILLVLPITFLRFNHSSIVGIQVFLCPFFNNFDPLSVHLFKWNFPIRWKVPLVSSGSPRPSQRKEGDKRSCGPSSSCTLGTNGVRRHGGIRLKGIR